MSRIRNSLWNSLEKVILYMLKISTKFGVAPQRFCENPNSVQNPTKFCLDPLTPSKVIVSTWKVHVCIARQTDRRTNFFLLILSSKTYKTWTFVKRREFFYLPHAITILYLFTYSVCDEKVKRTLLWRLWLFGKIKNCLLLPGICGMQ